MPKILQRYTIFINFFNIYPKIFFQHLPKNIFSTLKKKLLLWRMKRECSHIDFSRRQKLFAWIILSVYVPMVLLSSVHLHSMQEYAETVKCDLCQSAVHHSGHFISSPQQHDECLSCRFLTTQVDIPKTSVCFIAKQTVNKIEYFQATEPVVQVVAQPSLRAPPTIL